MNKSITTLLLLIPVITFGQMVRKPTPSTPIRVSIPFKHETTNWSDVTDFAEKIMTYPKHKYEIAKIDSSDRNPPYKSEAYSLKIKTTMISSGNDVIYLVYRQYPKGYNKDLEIRGTKTFFFEEIEGQRYLDMFEIWKALFDPKANAQEIASLEQTLVLLNDKQFKNASFFKSRNDDWIIKLWER